MQSLWRTTTTRTHTHTHTHTDMHTHAHLLEHLEPWNLREETHELADNRGRAKIERTSCGLNSSKGSWCVLREWDLRLFWEYTHTHTETYTYTHTHTHTHTHRDLLTDAGKILRHMLGSIQKQQGTLKAINSFFCLSVFLCTGWHVCAWVCRFRCAWVYQRLYLSMHYSKKQNMHIHIYHAL